MQTKYVFIDNINIDKNIEIFNPKISIGTSDNDTIDKGASTEIWVSSEAQSVLQSPKFYDLLDRCSALGMSIKPSMMPWKGFRSKRITEQNLNDYNQEHNSIYKKKVEFQNEDFISMFSILSHP